MLCGRSPAGGWYLDPDVIQVELEFLHRHAKKARLNVSFDPTDQPSYVTKRAIAATDLQIR